MRPRLWFRKRIFWCCLIPALFPGLLPAAEPPRLPQSSAGPSTEAASASREADSRQRDARMAWWREARFGMFIHWGIMSIPGKDCWVMAADKIPVKEYEKLVPQYNPVKWNARDVVRLAKEAGQKYLVFVAKHHDGFCMWDSKLTEYDIMATPYGKDIVRQLADECAALGVVFCIYYSILDWHHPQANAKNWPHYADYMRGQLRELLTNYGPIGVVWFDGEWAPEWTDAQGRELARFVSSIQPKTLVNNRVGKGRQDMAGNTAAGFFAADFDTPEQQVPPNGLPGVDWESCMTINGSWSWNKTDLRHKSAAECLELLVNTTSKGGNLLLNVGPHPDGSILPEQADRLRVMGKWLKSNSESVYGTRAAPFPRRLPWGDCSSRSLPDDVTRLYLHVVRWPTDGHLIVSGLLNDAQGAFLLSDTRRGALATSRGEEALVLRVPSAPPDPHVSVVVVDIGGPVRIAPFVIRPDATGQLTLHARDADLHGTTVRYPSGGGQESIGFWTNIDDWVSWPIRLDKPGKYRVEINYGCDRGQGGGEYAVQIADQELVAKAQDTGGWFQRVTQAVGDVNVAAGAHTLAIRLKTKPGIAVMDLVHVTLQPAEN